MKQFIFFLILICSYITRPYASTDDTKKIIKREIKFHQASSEAEKKLDYILHFGNLIEDDRYSKLYYYISKWPHTKPEMALEYTNLFTKDFIYAWSKAEKEEVDLNCEGRYRDADLCSFNFNVLTCSQDYDDVYFYRTIEKTEDYAIINYMWSSFHNAKKHDVPPIFDQTTHKLVKRDGLWLLDGVRCGSTNFNINLDKSHITSPYASTYDTKKIIKHEVIFHPAFSDAEKKLDYILHFGNIIEDDRYSKLGYYIGKWPHTKPEMALEYTNLFTKDFIYAWSKAEKEEASKTCEGRYRDADLCSFNFNVFTCSQDTSDMYFYRTIAEKEDQVIIEFAWIELDSNYHITNKLAIPIVRYRLSKQNDLWLIDGVKCINNDFNLNFNELE